jgi:hypothetical protein
MTDIRIRPEASTRGRQRAPRRARPWPVTLIGLLLLLEAAGFLGLALVTLGFDPQRGIFAPERLGLESFERIIGIVFGALALLAVVTAAGFLRMMRGAWVNAVLVQGADLLIGLTLYFRGRPMLLPVRTLYGVFPVSYVYLMLAYGILMVLYLHQEFVQDAFRSPTTRREGQPR